MKRSKFLSICIAVILLYCCTVPAGAVVLEVTIKGTVRGLSQVDNTLTLQDPFQYGCSYPAGGVPVCTWTPMTVTELTGTVPDASAFKIFSSGNPVVAKSLGGSGGRWITLAKLFGSRQNEEYVTDIVGDVGSFPTPLIGNYAIDTVTVPDCQNCTGTTCTAIASDVKLRSGEILVLEKNLTPKSSFTYNGRNDGSSVAVTFVSGQALSETCPGAPRLIGGVQPISDYIVKVVPPIGFGPTPAGTMATTTVPVTTPKTGVLPFAVIGALCVLGIVCIRVKRK